jgi:hypothetical protein
MIKNYLNFLKWKVRVLLFDKKLYFDTRVFVYFDTIMNNL